MSTQWHRLVRLMLLGLLLLAGAVSLTAGEASASHFRGGSASWVRVSLVEAASDGSIVVVQDFGILTMSGPVLRHSDGFGGGDSEDVDIAFSSNRRTETDAMLDWAREIMADPVAGPAWLQVQVPTHKGVRTFNLIDTWPTRFRIAGDKGGSAVRWRLEVRVNRIDMA